MEELDLHYIKPDPDFGIASEGVYINDEKEFVSRISKVKKTVTSINLNFQYALKKVPSVLKECEQLEKLNISHTGITEIPEFVFTMPNLQNLSCCCSDLQKFPKDIFKAKKLKRLHIRINKDWTIPKEIPPMPELEILAIDMYMPSALPDSLGNFKNLKQLLLAAKYTEGDVPALSPSLKNHPTLNELNYFDPFYKYRKNFDLDHAAKILSTCPSFEILKLSGFAVGKGHQALSKLKNLKTLELGHLLAEGNIFDSIADLEKLEIFGIWGSELKITDIPDIFANKKELQEFSFAGNMVTELPSSIYDLPKLRVLEIGSTGIYALNEKISGLQNLEKIHIYDSLLGNLPDAVFSLPHLKMLNIDENVFTKDVILKIKQKLKILEQKGQKIVFTYEGQGYRQMVKKLRVLYNNNSVSSEEYLKHCLNAINESPFAIKYVNASKIDGKLYAKLCMSAIRKDISAFSGISPEALGKQNYFIICMEAAKSQEIGNIFKSINSSLLSDGEYLQVCVEAALHNRSNSFIAHFNTEEFQKRYNREIYGHICWVAALHNPRTASKIIR